ncbi:MAG: hypothetical protein IIZ61_00725 [Lachnospiraceae bacterium]|nr:hypothetical protein [Lachnospiraceae bacterium]
MGDLASTYIPEGASTPTLIFCLIFYVLLVVAYWKMFTKADVAGWLSIIPIVNMYFLFKIAWGKGLLFLLLIIPIVNIVIYFILCIKTAKAYGQGTGFGIGLFLLPNIFTLILGFGSAEYVGVAE